MRYKGNCEHLLEEEVELLKEERDCYKELADAAIAKLSALEAKLAEAERERDAWKRTARTLDRALTLATGDEKPLADNIFKAKLAEAEQEARNAE
jgi:transposase